jgi:hypothetical protein
MMQGFLMLGKMMMMMDSCNVYVGGEDGEQE